MSLPPAQEQIGIGSGNDRIRRDGELLAEKLHMPFSLASSMQDKNLKFDERSQSTNAIQMNSHFRQPVQSSGLSHDDLHTEEPQEKGLDLFGIGDRDD